MQLIPLSKLDQSEDNVCKRSTEFEERLSFDIERAACCRTSSSPRRKSAAASR